VNTGGPSTRATQVHRPDSLPSARRRRTLAGAGLALTLVGGGVGLRIWMADPSPDARLASEPTTTAPLLGSPSPDAPLASEPATTAPLPGGTGIQPELALPAIPPPYTVETGDTLIGIALKFETAVEMLALVNDLSDPNVLHVGQVLAVPPSQISLESADPSEALRDIAPIYDLDPVTLAAYNGLGPEHIDSPLGRDAILVPVRSGTPAVSAPSEERTPREIYTVEEGDTLISIAQKLGVDLDALIAANELLADPDLIVVGEKLLIPEED